MKYKLLLLIFLFTPVFSLATTGGPHELETLGYNDSAVYLLHYYQDESARPPALWKYDLRSKKLIIDYNWSTYPDEEIEDGIKRMGWDKLTPALFDNDFDLGNISITALDSLQLTDTDTEENYTIYPYRFSYKDQSVTVRQCYKKEEPIIFDFYSTEGIHFMHIRYSGLCYEGGYDKDTLFVFWEEDPMLTEPALGAIEISDSTNVEGNKENSTYWEKGKPNYIYIFLPIILIIIPFVILKWKKKDEKTEK